MHTLGTYCLHWYHPKLWGWLGRGQSSTDTTLPSLAALATPSAADTSRRKEFDVYLIENCKLKKQWFIQQDSSQAWPQPTYAV